ncbi:MAG: hypothetical protein HFJ43_00555 [Clostridia bacterium]|nr:hypothetical protein [Clostridia bacterium]
MKQIFSKVKYDTKELIDSNIQMINLEYYKIFKENRRSYGIEIVKTELKEDREIIENKKLEDISNNEYEVNSILEIFTKTKVTPVISEDVIEDFYKR